MLKVSCQSELTVHAFVTSKRHLCGCWELDERQWSISPGIKPRAPGLCSQCSATELQQPDNYQPPQSSICTVQVVLKCLSRVPSSHSKSLFVRQVSQHFTKMCGWFEARVNFIGCALRLYMAYTSVHTCIHAFKFILLFVHIYIILLVGITSENRSRLIDSITF